MTVPEKASDRSPSRRSGSRGTRPRRRHRPSTPGLDRLEGRLLLSLTFTDFPMTLVALVEPQGITTGPDGNLWFAESGSGQIGRMTPSGQLTQFALPDAATMALDNAGSDQGVGAPTAITTGPDGALWFVGMPGEVGRITTSGTVSEFPVPDVPATTGSDAAPAYAPVLTSIAAGPDGALWFTGVPGEIGRISTAGVVTEFPIPEASATPNAIVAGPDGALWFTGIPGEVGRITTSGTVTEFPIPDIPPPAGSPAGTAPTQATAEGIAVGPDATLWFVGISGEVGRITTSGTVTEFSLANAATPDGTATPSSDYNSGPPSIVAGADGNIWFTGAANGMIGVITPSGTVTEYPVPGNYSTLGTLTAGPDGNVWFTVAEDGVTAGQQPAVGEIAPDGTTTIHTLPQGTTTNPNLGVDTEPSNIANASDGSIWFLDNDGIGRITSGGSLQQLPASLSDGYESQLVADSNGTAWFSENSNPDENAPTEIAQITASGSTTVYNVPHGGYATDIAPGRKGSVWFIDSAMNPVNIGSETWIGRITADGAIKTFKLKLPKKEAQVGPFAIAVGRNGNAYVIGGAYQAPQSQSQLAGQLGLNESATSPHGTEVTPAQYAYLAEITARGKVRMFPLPAGISPGSNVQPAGESYPAYTNSLIAGRDGSLWFDAARGKTPGLAQVSTQGKLDRFIPANVTGSLVPLADGRIWFPATDMNSGDAQLGVVTPSGVVATIDLPGEGPNASTSLDGLAAGPGGTLYYTDGTSALVRVGNLDSVMGGLDNRVRPRRAPDFVASQYTSSYWTNTTTEHHPTFAGVARPGAEVTLQVQKQGQTQPVTVGTVRAGHDDGTWTIKSHVRFADGTYAVTATQSGDTGPPTELYSLQPDSSGNLSSALVIVSAQTGKKASH